MLEFLGSGLPVGAIAEQMRIEKGIIKTYSRRLSDKLGVATLKALRAFAIESTL